MERLTVEMGGLRYGRSTTAVVVSIAVVATLVLQAQMLQGQADISVGFYDQICPNAESIVTQTVKEFNSRDQTIPAALLRLLFHDCFVEVPIFSNSSS